MRSEFPGGLFQPSAPRKVRFSWGPTPKSARVARRAPAARCFCVGPLPQRVREGGTSAPPGSCPNSLTHSESSSSSSSSSRRERWAVGLAIGAWAALHAVFLLHRRFGSDEPQHLHVAWAWTRGLLPYRDVFDNHAPLFHLLTAPLLRAVGERATALLWMRVAMVPVVAVLLFALHRLAAVLFGAEAARWTLALAAFYPPFFGYSVEFRTDVPWAALWILALAQLVGGGALTPMRGFVAGLWLGAMLGVSLKSTVLVAALALAAAGVVGLDPTLRNRNDLARIARSGAALAAGACVVPALLIALFGALGAARELLDCTVRFNTSDGLVVARSAWMRLLPTLLVPPAAAAARFWLRSDADPGVARRRAWLWLAGCFYIWILVTFWPLLTRQDWLPMDPLVVLFAVAALFHVLRSASARVRSDAALVVLVAEIAILLIQPPLRRDGTAADVAMVRDALRLTAPHETVLDTKGELIFRPRPVRWVLETITRGRMQSGVLADTTPERVAASGTCLAVLDSPRFSDRTRSFLSQNFVSVGSVRVAGRLLDSAARAGGEPIPFEVGIPARYAILSQRGEAHGRLDGEPYVGPRFLAAGRHQFEPDPLLARRLRRGDGIAVIWARAAQCGYRPFEPLAPRDGKRSRERSTACPIDTESAVPSATLAAT